MPATDPNAGTYTSPTTTTTTSGTSATGATPVTPPPPPPAPPVVSTPPVTSAPSATGSSGAASGIRPAPPTVVSTQYDKDRQKMAEALEPEIMEDTIPENNPYENVVIDNTLAGIQPKEGRAPSAGQWSWETQPEFTTWYGQYGSKVGNVTGWTTQQIFENWWAGNITKYQIQGEYVPPQYLQKQAPVSVPNPSEMEMSSREVMIGSVKVVDQYPTQYKDWYEKQMEGMPKANEGWYWDWGVSQNGLPQLSQKPLNPDVTWNAQQIIKDFEDSSFKPVITFTPDTGEFKTAVESNVEGFTANVVGNQYQLTPDTEYWDEGIPVSQLSQDQMALLGLDTSIAPDAKITIEDSKLMLVEPVVNIDNIAPTDYSGLAGKPLSQAPIEVQNLFPEASQADIIKNVTQENGQWTIEVEAWQNTMVYTPIETETGKYGKYVSIGDPELLKAELPTNWESKQLAGDVRQARELIPEGTVLTNVYRENDQIISEYMKPVVEAPKTDKVDWGMQITYKNFKMGNEEQTVEVPSIAGELFNAAGPNETLTTKNFKLGNQPYDVEINPLKTVAGGVGSVEGIVNPNVPTMWAYVFDNPTQKQFLANNPQYGIGAMEGEILQFTIPGPSLGIKLEDVAKVISRGLETNRLTRPIYVPTVKVVEFAGSKAKAGISYVGEKVSAIPSTLRRVAWDESGEAVLDSVGRQRVFNVVEPKKTVNPFEGHALSDLQSEYVNNPTNRIEITEYSRNILGEDTVAASVGGMTRAEDDIVTSALAKEFTSGMANRTTAFGTKPGYTKGIIGEGTVIGKPISDDALKVMRETPQVAEVTKGTPTIVDAQADFMSRTENKLPNTMNQIDEYGKSIDINKNFVTDADKVLSDADIKARTEPLPVTHIGVGSGRADVKEITGHLDFRSPGDPWAKEIIMPENMQTVLQGESRQTLIGLENKDFTGLMEEKPYFVSPENIPKTTGIWDDIKSITRNRIQGMGKSAKDALGGLKKPADRYGKMLGDNELGYMRDVRAGSSPRMKAEEVLYNHGVKESDGAKAVSKAGKISAETEGKIEIAVAEGGREEHVSRPVSSLWKKQIQDEVEVSVRDYSYFPKSWLATQPAGALAQINSKAMMEKSKGTAESSYAGTLPVAEVLGALKASAATRAIPAVTTAVLDTPALRQTWSNSLISQTRQLGEMDLSVVAYPAIGTMAGTTLDAGTRIIQSMRIPTEQKEDTVQKAVSRSAFMFKYNLEDTNRMVRSRRHIATQKSLNLFNAPINADEILKKMVNWK